MNDKLKKEIGLWDGILIVINSIVGTGIFFVPQITAEIAGASSYFIWIFLAWISVVVSVIFADLVYMFPRAGGVYDYVKKSFNEIFGFLVGWIEIVVSWIIVSMIVARISAEVFNHFGIPSLITVFIILTLFHYIVYRGIRSSKYLLLAFAFWTLLTIGLGIYYFSGIPINTSFRYSVIQDPILIILAAYLAFESYARWENIAFLAEESKNPKKDLPIALMLGNFVTVVFYLILAYFIISIALQYGDIFKLRELGNILLLFVLIQSLGTSFAWIVVIPRLLYALGRDQVLPELFAKLNSKGVPTYAILIQYLFILFFSLTGTFESLLSIIPPMLAILYIIVLISYIKVKLSNSAGFLSKNLAIGMALISMPLFFVILLVGGLRSAMAILLALVAFPIYFGMNMHKFAEATRTIHDLSAHVIDFFSNLWLKQEYIDEIILYLYPFSSKRILDFGCGTGKVAISLAREDPSVQVYASDISRVEIAILKKKLNKMKIKNVFPFIDEKDRINRKFWCFFDAVVSVGALGYIKNVELFLDDLRRALKPGGKFIFIEFDKLFGLFSAPEWIRNKRKLKELFKRRGLYVRILEKNELLWKVIYIYGYKPSIKLSKESIKGHL